MKYLAIHGAPRSGTTLLAEIINSSPDVLYRYQPLFSWELKDFLGTRSSRADVARFFEALRATPSDFMDQTEARRAGRLPHFEKREPAVLAYKEVRYHHLLPRLMGVEPNLMLIGIIRDPVATLASWYAAPREFRADLGWQLQDEWRHAKSKNGGRPEEFFGFEGWKQCANILEGCQAAFGERVRLVRYEQLLEDSRGTAATLFAWLDLTMESQTSVFIENAFARDVAGEYSVFRSRGRRAYCKLPDAIAAEIRMELEGSPLAHYLVSGDLSEAPR